MYYVYVLRSIKAENQLYVGYTENVEARLKKHNAGEVPSTKPYVPWENIFYEAFISKKDAQQRERYLKTTQGRRTLRLMLKEAFSE